MNTQLEKLSDQLSGKQCANFRFVEGGTLILYFQLNSEAGSQISATFWIDCAWRMRTAENMLIGFQDSPGRVLEQLRKLQEMVLTSVKVDNNTSDLLLSFSNGLVIEAFCYSTELEVWEFRRSDGYRLGVGPNIEPFENWVIV